MDHLIGQRFNLISKSEIRYLGTLHEINPEDSTIALEDVYSFGTEDRKAANFIPPSPRKFDYIVFRGGDVKDIKIADEQKEDKQPSPQNIPNDPAILNASRPTPVHPQGPPRDQSPFHPPGFGPPPQFGGYYPPPQYGRGFGPPPPGSFGPGPAFQGPPPDQFNRGFGPPPGYLGPPGQGFPHGPNQFQQQPQPPPPIGTPGQHPHPGEQAPASRQSQPNEPTSELPAPLKSAGKAGTPRAQDTEPATATDALKPTSTSTTATGTVPPATSASAAAGTASKPPPAGPKGGQIKPAVPMQVNQKSFTPPVTASASGPLSSASGNAASKPAPTQAAMEAASRQAKEAVAAAMAKLKPQTAAAAPQPPQPSSNTAAVEALTRKVSEMKTDSSPRGGRGSHRGRGDFRRGSGSRKMEIPKSDYDFESANAKFNREDLVKEAIAAVSPVGETPDVATNGEHESEPASDGITRRESLPINDRAYDKKSSFFDNISSETRDREEATERAGGRVFRGEEFKKNLETFGQGNVEGGFRGRGRGYGRGGFGRGRGYGGNPNHRGYGGRGGFNNGGDYRSRGRGGAAAGGAQTTAAS